MTIREYLKKLGATENELTAKVVSRMENAMLIDSDLTQYRADTILKIIETSANGLEMASNTASNLERAAKRANSELRNTISYAQEQIEDFQEQTAGLTNAKIESSEIKDAVMAYAAVLRATKDIFGGESINPDVMVAAIKAGSYISWRSLMVPKHESDGYDPFD